MLPCYLLISKSVAVLSAIMGQAIIWIKCKMFTLFIEKNCNDQCTILLAAVYFIFLATVLEGS